MSNKNKSPNKANSPSDEIKVDDVKTDVAQADTAKDKFIVDSNVDEASANQSSDSKTPVQSKSDSQKQQPSKKATARLDKNKPSDTPQVDNQPAKTPQVKRGFPFFGVFNLLLIIGLMAAAFYYWQMQQKNESEKRGLLLELRTQIDKKANLEQVQTRVKKQVNEQFSLLESGIGNSETRIDELQKQQQELKDSTEKLFDLYGRSDSDWQLSEVVYLLRIAQHKLALENDFEGAALTLQAASDKIAVTADPGLLPVRVLISEEVANLKTRARPDLVGMTLLLSQLSQQILAIKPGYQAGIKAINTQMAPTELGLSDSVDATIKQKITAFITSLVTIKRSTAEPVNTAVLTVNIQEIMESNLKLTRWTVLERNDFQYRQLMAENIRLFKQYYDLDDAANNDFYAQLLQLQKSVIKPSKPAINGSLQLLNNIISQRQNAPSANNNLPEVVAPKPASTDAVNEAADNV
jgi:uroporphyrin-3 C-methyltransferase|tara:strand:- start:3040 stop:4434 length:1395 start_codon:yes stop_codon:yes gene_type:complete